MLRNKTNADRRSASRTGGQDFGDAVSLFGAMRSTSVKLCANNCVSGCLYVGDSEGGKRGSTIFQDSAKAQGESDIERDWRHCNRDEGMY